MDPLSVLGVVAAIVQFVDFSAKLLSRSLTTYTSGSGELFDEKRRTGVVEDLRLLNEKIKTTSKAAVRTRVTDQHGSDLLELCAGCDDVARDLLDALNKLKVNKAKNKKWESCRVALQSIWSGDAVDRLEHRLSAYRQQISLHMIWGMRKQLEFGLGDLAQEQKRTRDEIVDFIRERRDWKEGVIAAIAAAPLPRVKPNTFDESQTRFLQRMLTQHYFERISNREQRIPDAHRATFEWVFQPPKADQLPWADFGKWLEYDSSMYWITGKAGAGKSTLMKFIGHDTRTTQILTKSAGDRRLIIARHYFWNSGEELQMTQEGLLRTLIHDILQQADDLAIRAFPHEWELFRHFEIFDSKPPDYVGLQSRLDKIIKADPSAQFVFFIDGLDEFTGDHSGLATYMKRLSDIANTKVCVSSRPWNEFEDAFASTPSLRVEDLTYQDIICFIQSNFNESPGYAELQMENEEEAEALLHAIASKASGVFLWVSVVVKLLLSGLMNGERLSRLRRHLDSLPQDLEQLFQRMLDQIGDENQEDASRIFQIVRASIHPPTVMTLAWADEDDPNLPFNRAVEPLSSRERDARSRRMRRRLISHCRGLLEAQRSSLSEGTVEFLHRTVRDFLYRDEVWSKLQSCTSTSFHPEQALCRSYVLQLKCVNGNLGLVHGSIDLTLERGGEFHEVDLFRLLPPFVWYTYKLYEKTGDAQLQLYDELEKAIKVIFERGNSCPSTDGLCWCEGPVDHDDGPFLSLAIALHLIPYLDARLKRVPIRESKGRGVHSVLQAAVLFAIGAASKRWEKALCYRDDDSQLLRLLLAHGADPNLSTKHQTASAWKLLMKQDGVTPDMFREFLQYGADPKVDLSFLHDRGPKWEPLWKPENKREKVQKRKYYTSRIRRLKFWS